MNQTIIYGRVSTDEQALNGYSLPDQMEKLEKFCIKREDNIVLRITEDFSAKTFERPAFLKVLEFIKANRGLVTHFLVLKWSRFSRNTYESYRVIDEFRKLGIEVNAIEQPIDWTIAQNKYLLALYLVEPEVDNDVRSKSVIDGMRKANKDGRYLGCAPKGYDNKRDENDKPIIVPNEQAAFISEGFILIESKIYNQAEALSILIGKGFKCSKSQFSELLKNRIYAGKVYIKPYNKEEGYWIDGIHQSLVSEELFDRVQVVLTKRIEERKSTKPKQRDENLPLRGHVKCTKCEGKLTGSKSKGNGGQYYYYHCNGCNIRFRADLLNDQIVEKLEEIEFSSEAKELYLEVIKEELKGDHNGRKNEIKKREVEVTTLETRLNKLMDDKLDGTVSSEDYLIAKARYKTRIATLKEEINNISYIKSEFDDYLNYGFSLLQNVSSYYSNATITAKQQIIGSIYPELMTFEKNQLRTNKINEVVELITLFNKASRGNKNRTKSLKKKLSCLVPGTGVEPVRFPTGV